MSPDYFLPVLFAIDLKSVVKPLWLAHCQNEKVCSNLCENTHIQRHTDRYKGTRISDLKEVANSVDRTEIPSPLISSMTVGKLLCL